MSFEIDPGHSCFFYKSYDIEVLDYILSQSFSAYQWIYLLSMCFALANFVKYRKYGLIAFVLVVICLFEFIIPFIQIYYQKTNIGSYNVYSHLMIVLLVSIFAERLNKVVLYGFMSVWLGTTIVLAAMNGLNEKVLPTYVVGFTFVVFAILRYFRAFLVEAQKVDLFDDYRTYLGFGCLVFYACSFPILVFVNRLVLDASLELAYFDLLNIANVIMGIGFLLSSIVIWKKT